MRHRVTFAIGNILFDLICFVRLRRSALPASGGMTVDGMEVNVTLTAGMMDGRSLVLLECFWFSLGVGLLPVESQPIAGALGNLVIMLCGTNQTFLTLKLPSELKMKCLQAKNRFPPPLFGLCDSTVPEPHMLNVAIRIDV